MTRSEFMSYKKGKVTGVLIVVLYQEDDYFYAYSPALDLIAEGENEKKAKKAFEDTLSLYLDHVIENGTFQKDLKSQGWTIKQWSKSKFFPSDYDEQQIMSERGVSNYVKSEIQIPVPA